MSGFNSAPEYQLSGLPFATSSVASNTDPYYVGFPYATKFFSIKNTSSNYMAIGFTRNGILGGSRFTLAPSGSFTEDIRLIDLYLMGIGGLATFELIAGLTTVDRKDFPVLTASAAPGIISASSNSRQFGYVMVGVTNASGGVGGLG